MLCDFVAKNSKWICQKCGRQANKTNDEEFMPTAKCRIPEKYYFNSGYINNLKIKGVGDMISIIIKKLGYSYNPLGTARLKLTYLNNKGIDWCDKNQDLIYNWLKEECILNNLVLLPMAGRAIVRLAIIKAKNQEIML